MIGDIGQGGVGRRVRAVAMGATYSIAEVIPGQGEDVRYRLNPLSKGGNVVTVLASDLGYYLAPPDGNPPPPPAQRSGIGLIESGPVGRLVCKLLAAMWKISSAAQVNDAWQYTLTHINLVDQTRVVSAADPAWELADTPPDGPKELRVAQLVATHPPALPPRGGVSAWQRTGPFLSVPMGQMVDTDLLGQLVTWGANAEAEAIMSAGKADVVWSGGAANCVIVGAHTSGRAFLTHATQLQPPGDDIGLMIRTLGPSPQVWLASQKFAASPQAVKDSGLIQQIAEGLSNHQVQVTAIFSSDRLAIDVATGNVSANFANPLTEAFLQANPVSQGPAGALADLADDQAGQVIRVSGGELVNTAQVVPAQDADQALFASPPQPTDMLWSGTAKQEVIVGAQAGGQAVLARCTKSLPQPGDVIGAITALGPNCRVWLSSQAFTDPDASESKVIGIVAGALSRAGIRVNAVYATGCLAIKVATGQVLASFAIPKT